MQKSKQSLWYEVRRRILGVLNCGRYWAKVWPTFIATSGKNLAWCSKIKTKKSSNWRRNLTKTRRTAVQQNNPQTKLPHNLKLKTHWPTMELPSSVKVNLLGLQISHHSSGKNRIYFTFYHFVVFIWQRKSGSFRSLHDLHTAHGWARGTLEETFWSEAYWHTLSGTVC